MIPLLVSALFYFLVFAHLYTLQEVLCFGVEKITGLRHHTRTSSLLVHAALSRTTSMVIEAELQKKDDLKSFSLAGPYLVEITRESSTTSSICSFYDLVALESLTDEAFRHSEGAIAWDCITNNQHLITRLSPLIQMRISQNDKAFILHVSVEQNDGTQTLTNPDLYQVLSRTLVQDAIRKLPPGRTGEPAWSICWDDDIDSPIDCFVAQDWNDEEMVKALFAGIIDVVPGETELVEMVDQFGHPIGQVPRKLVHKHNLLHRGIGLFVTKDEPIEPSVVNPEAQPHLYVHQRTPTKRIFPSLYDMFVGGVSVAKEPSRLTAEREVAEELGLSRGSTNLSECLWTCIVCTAYNRCVVDFFTYRMETDEEAVSWQEEEVAWGAFVPYKVVAASADLSIERLVEKKEWPGRSPPVFSKVQTGEVTSADIGEHTQWNRWDYVPDGLLVWEAWLEWSESQKNIK